MHGIFIAYIATARVLFLELSKIDIFHYERPAKWKFSMILLRHIEKHFYAVSLGKFFVVGQLIVKVETNHT